MSELGAQLEISPTADGWMLSGEVDAHTAPALAATMSQLPAGTVTIDVAEVSFMDSSGLRVLMDVTTRARGAGGDLVVLRPTAAIVRLVEISGLADHLRLEPAAVDGSTADA
jgi:anti-sigma B factor antagonist